MDNLGEIQSPCINVCIIDPQSGFCQGCWRTLDEISHWRFANREQKLAVLSELKSRNLSAKD